ncbi:MAG: hypothetical protein H8E98_02680 [Bacteroidetes bacterium]|nr:hypothetical protein [Bacteroidota bacterium]
MKIEIKKIGDEYIASDKRTNIELIKTSNKDKLAKQIFNKAVGSFSSSDLAKYKKSKFRKIINQVDKSGDYVFYLGENTMKKSELKQLIRKEIINTLVESKNEISNPKDYFHQIAIKSQKISKEIEKLYDVEKKKPI